MLNSFQAEKRTLISSSPIQSKLTLVIIKNSRRGSGLFCSDRLIIFPVSLAIYGNLCKWVPFEVWKAFDQFICSRLQIFSMKNDNCSFFLRKWRQWKKECSISKKRFSKFLPLLNMWNSFPVSGNPCWKLLYSIINVYLFYIL